MEITYGSSQDFAEISGGDSEKASGGPKIVTGKKLEVVVYGDRIEMIPLRKIADMKGFLKGIDTTVEREPDRL